MTKKDVDLYDMYTEEIVVAEDTYLVLHNTGYVESDIGYYSVGTLNTSVRHTIRLTFTIDNLKVILRDTLDGTGSYAQTVWDYVKGLEEHIQILADSSKPFDETGIQLCNDGKLIVLTVNENYLDDELEINMQDFMNSLTKIELINFDWEHIEK